MGVRNQNAILWAAFTGKAPPRSIGEVVRTAGGAAGAARLARRAVSTVRGWVREENKATGTVEAMVRTVGGTAPAAEAAGVSERTVRRWQQQEREGKTPGKRQQARIDRLQQAATRAHTAAVSRSREAVTRMQSAVLDDAASRTNAIGARRASRMANTGVRIQLKGSVSVIDTDPMDDDTRERHMQVEFDGPVMRETVDEWTGGGSSEDVLDKMSEAFTKHYLHSQHDAREAVYGRGARMQINDIKAASFSQRTPGKPGFKYRE